MNTPAEPASESPVAEPVRLASLDALRGFDMFWILGATSIAGALEKMKANEFTTLLTAQLTHVTWEGFRFYDLIFPLFLFIVGVSMVFSLDKALAKGGRGAVLWRVLRRSLLLFALGVFASGGLSKSWPDVALGGVLHRIAACYLLASLTYVLIRSARGLVCASALLLVGYWALLTFVPVPDFKLDKPVVDEIATRIGSRSPDAISASVTARVTGSYEEGRNLTNHLDFRFLPGRKAQEYYINEGLLSTLPAVALSLFGALAALLFKNTSLTPSKKMLWLIAGGLVCVALGLLWSVQFPMIKRIWTSSFVLVAGGTAACLMALFYGIVDVLGWRTWCRPFIWIGCNPLTLYILNPIVGFQSLATRLVGGDVRSFLDAQVSPGFGGLVVAATGMLLVVLLARFLYRRGIFLRV
jgi:predicted acyltransferase